jgi:hypothetical protein
MTRKKTTAEAVGLPREVSRTGGMNEKTRQRVAVSGA